jgi:hypothetical protein
MTYRINAFRQVMSEHAGIWTTLPPKKARSVLFAMERRVLINLISILAAIAFLTLTQTFI